MLIKLSALFDTSMAEAPTPQGTPAAASLTRSPAPLCAGNPKIRGLVDLPFHPNCRDSLPASREVHPPPRPVPVPRLVLAFWRRQVRIGFRLSRPRDGKKFAIARARYNDSDVVMFTGFR